MRIQAYISMGEAPQICSGCGQAEITTQCRPRKLAPQVTLREHPLSVTSVGSYNPQAEFNLTTQNCAGRDGGMKVNQAESLPQD